MFFVAIYSTILYIVAIYLLSPAMNWLESLRNDIDRIDENIIDLLAKRQKISQKIWNYKRENKLPIVDMDQFANVLKMRIVSAQRKWLHETYVKQLWTIIHDESVKVQEAA
jgi:chorismate mutase